MALNLKTMKLKNDISHIFSRFDYEFPEYPNILEVLILEFKDRFSTLPGLTEISYHRISVGDNKPVRGVPAHFQKEVDNFF